MDTRILGKIFFKSTELTKKILLLMKISEFQNDYNKLKNKSTNSHSKWVENKTKYVEKS